MKQLQRKIVQSNPPEYQGNKLTITPHCSLLSKDGKTPQQTYKADRTLEDSVAKTQLLVSARVTKNRVKII